MREERIRNEESGKEKERKVRERDLQKAGEGIQNASPPLHNNLLITSVDVYLKYIKKSYSTKYLILSLCINCSKVCVIERENNTDI